MRFIISWAIIYRIIGIYSTPVLEDDFYRYLWDGFIFFNNASPYGVIPLEFTGSELPVAFANILDNINYPEYPTIYGPVSQYIFLLGYLLRPGSIIILKLIISLFELGALYCMRHLVNSRHLLLYAWSPLLIIEGYYNCHIDLLGMSWIIFAIAATQRQRPMVAAIWLAISCGTKAIAYIFVPFFLIRSQHSIKCIFAVTLALLYLPVINTHAIAEINTIFVMLNNWEYNSFIFGIIKFLGGMEFAKYASLAICGAAFGSYLIYCRQMQRAIRGDIIFAIFIVLSPVINAWYLLWALPFIVIYPTCTGLLGLWLVYLSYCTGLNIASATVFSYNHPVWVRFVEFGPLILTALVDGDKRCLIKRITSVPLFQRIMSNRQ